MNIEIRYLLRTLIASTIITELVSGKKEVACFNNGDCGFLQPKCTAEEVMEVTNLRYGYKSNSTCKNPNAICNTASFACCNAGINDCKQNYTAAQRIDFHQQCSGMELGCKVRAASASIHCGSDLSETKEQLHSTYAILTYNCVNESKIRFQCQTGNIEGTEVHLMLKNVSRCPGLSCTATSSQSLSLTVVDVRLQQIEGRCSTNISINGDILDCKTFLHNYEAISETRGVKGAEINIRNVLFNRTSIIWIKLKASENVKLSCKRYGTPPSSTTTAEGNAFAAHTPDASDPIPIVVSVIIVVLVAAVASIAVFLWRRGKCLQKPKLTSIFNIGTARDSDENKANDYVDPNKIHSHRQLTQNALSAVSVPPVSNYFELEPQYAESNVRNSTYAEISEDNRQPVDKNQALSEYDKLGMERKTTIPIETVNNDYSHIKINEDQTPYSHIGKMSHGKGVNRKPLSEYSHVQPAQGVPSEVLETKADGSENQSDMSDYSHLANCRREDRTEAGATGEEEKKYMYDLKERNTNVDESDTYSHLHPSKS